MVSTGKTRRAYYKAKRSSSKVPLHQREPLNKEKSKFPNIITHRGWNEPTNYQEWIEDTLCPQFQSARASGTNFDSFFAKPFCLSEFTSLYVESFKTVPLVPSNIVYTIMNSSFITRLHLCIATPSSYFTWCSRDGFQAAELQVCNVVRVFYLSKNPCCLDVTQQWKR